MQIRRNFNSILARFEWADKERSRSYKTRNNRRTGASEHCGTPGIRKKIGTHRWASFRLADDYTVDR